MSSLYVHMYTTPNFYLFLLARVTRIVEFWPFLSFCILGTGSQHFICIAKLVFFMKFDTICFGLPFGRFSETFGRFSETFGRFSETFGRFSETFGRFFPRKQIVSHCFQLIKFVEICDRLSGRNELINLRKFPNRNSFAPINWKIGLAIHRQVITTFCMQTKKLLKFPPKISGI
jgi:hypothetical protein